MSFNSGVKIQVHTATGEEAISTDKTWYGSHDLILNMSTLFSVFSFETHIKHK